MYEVNEPPDRTVCVHIYLKAVQIVDHSLSFWFLVCGKIENVCLIVNHNSKLTWVYSYLAFLVVLSKFISK